MKKNPASEFENRRVLVIDDNPDIHQDFRKILCQDSSQKTALDEAASALFGDSGESQPAQSWDVDSAFQGAEGLEMVAEARRRDAPYAMAFVDMRMPPGWDGLTTIQNIWRQDPELEIVICTAYSDRSWKEIVETLGQSSQLLVLKKPFDVVEVLQMASCLCEKWKLQRWANRQRERMENMVKTVTSETMRAHRKTNEFLSSIRIQLISPITGIAGVADQLQDAPLGDEQRASLAELRGCTEELLGRVRDIIDFNELVSNQMTLKCIAFDPRDVCVGVAQAFAGKAVEKGVELDLSWRTELPSAVQGDASRISQVLAKLVDNAIDHNDEGTVRIGVDHEEASDGVVILCFTVTDHGCGMSADLIPRAASSEGPLQLDGSHRLGLGLALANRLAHLMGGMIRIDSEEGKGTVVRFTAKFQCAPTPSLTSLTPEGS